MSPLPILSLIVLLSLAPLQQQRISAPAPTAVLEPEAPAAVRWHASYDEALAASRQSGKPVMLFQLLGRLDDALC